MSLSFATDKTLAEFSTFGIGGPIAYFAEVTTIEEMREGILFSVDQNLPLLVVGRGSNCLFDDAGFSGVVLHNKIDFCTWKEGDLQVYVGGGYNFSLLGVQSARKDWSGLEFGSGIPGSVGGAVFMNAGANGRETSASVVSVVYMDMEGNTREYRKEEIVFGYRFSSFQKKQGAIVAATFAFTKSPRARDKQIQMVERRIKTQPLKEKSIGCVFRNPETVSAGFLIEQCGLKGTREGGAKISDLHANFIINDEGATGVDVQNLIKKIQSKVLKETGFQLQTEIWHITNG